MILVPKMYLRDGKVAARQGTTSPLFQDDPFATAQAMTDSGAEAIQIVDLGIPHVGTSPHLPIITRIHHELEVAVYVGGSFKTTQSVESFMNAEIELVALDSVAYQQPAFLKEVIEQFPARVAVHIDVKAGRVTIPGYTVVANKTALDYAERFIDQGVRFILYSDVGPSGTMENDNFDQLLEFCNKATARIFCTSEISSLADMQRIALLGAPRLDALVLDRSLAEGHIDLRGAIAMLADLSLESSDEATLTDM